MKIVFIIKICDRNVNKTSVNKNMYNYYVEKNRKNRVYDARRLKCVNIEQSNNNNVYTKTKLKF